MITTTFEVWDGSGELRLSTSDYTAAYQLCDELNDTEEYRSRVSRVNLWPCQNCRRVVSTPGGHDTECACGAQYNGFGQRLRDNWRDNMSNYDDDISDMDGYENACAARED